MTAGWVGDRKRTRKRDRAGYAVGCLLITFLVPGSATCGGDPTGPEVSNDPRLTAQPGAPPASILPGQVVLDLDAGRDAILYVPEIAADGTPVPLLVMLHGAGGNAQGLTGAFTVGEEQGFAVLLPNSRQATWDRVTIGFGPDVEFLDAALRATFERVAVDAGHIALAGFSDGASYALSLGLSNGDLFTHLIGFSPGFLGAADPIVGEPRIFVSHGTRDGVLSVGTTRDRIVPTLRDADYDVTYEEFDGGHELRSETFRSALDWWLTGL